MKKSRVSTAFLKVIPVLGSITLFLAWVFQQTLLGDAKHTAKNQLCSKRLSDVSIEQRIVHATWQ
jgi:hypothetical protein